MDKLFYGVLGLLLILWAATFFYLNSKVDNLEALAEQIHCQCPQAQQQEAEPEQKGWLK